VGVSTGEKRKEKKGELVVLKQSDGEDEGYERKEKKRRLMGKE